MKTYSEDALAIILLTSYVALTDAEHSPLSNGEWNQLATRIFNSSIKTPKGLFNLDKEKIQDELQLSIEEANRIEILLSRGGLLALELEILMNKGIHFVTRVDADYPKALKEKLKSSAPPVICYAGHLDLLDQYYNQSIAFVGSRHVDDSDIEHTQKIVHQAVHQGFAVVSGGAKGVDSIAEDQAIQSGGVAISFIADSLEHKIKKQHVRQAIEDKQLLILSAIKPNGGFSVASAMNRNKFIYALSSGAFVIKSDYKKGGTWTGATENLRHQWSKCLILNHSNYKGNQELIKLGGYPIEINSLEDLNLHHILSDANSSHDNKFVQNQLF